MYISSKLFYILEQAFTNDFHSYERCICNNVNFENSNVLNKLFVIDISSDFLEIPVFGLPAFRKNFHSTGEKIVIPMYQDKNTVEVSSTAVIKEFLQNTSFSERITKIEYREETYYGGRGIILDKEFIPLLLYSLNFEREYLNQHTNINYMYSSLHINPKVFTDQGIIHKFIINKIIPFYCTYPIKNAYSLDIREKVKILIDNTANSYIVTPIEPENSENFNEDINQFLIDNINTILAQI